MKLNKELLSWNDFEETVELVHTRFDAVLDKLYFANNVKVERLRNCQATVYFVDSYIVLKSYNTYVAIYATKTKRLFVNGYYSPTTQQHISKFIAGYCKDIHERLQSYTDGQNRYFFSYYPNTYRKHLKTGDYEYLW